MRGDVINDARASIDQSGMRAGGAKVDIEMNTRGAKRFSRVTASNVNKFLAIVLDSTIYSAPRIIQKIPLGRAEITGNFTMDEAKNLAIVLRAGALPAPVSIIEERTVGPSLGQDSIKKGMYAGLIGTAIVILFMLIYYQLSGVIALIALILNVISVLAIMAGVHATLTLPGIAGLILLIGIGVDANVIIFERIREEMALGKTVRSAIDAGYSSAFVTIMDANLTTLFTAFILFWKGTGPIRGFAIILIFGIITSLFTALFVSRLLMNLIVNKTKNSLSI
jgi:preprotein translocase subunit SecD